jgi:NADH-quinone oxidoreductase subunit F
MNFASLAARADPAWDSMENSDEILIQIGTGTCGHAAGAGKILERLDQTVQREDYACRILQVGCIGMCYAEPLMALRKSGGPFLYYGNLTPDAAEEILVESVTKGRPAARAALCSRGAKTVDGIPQFEELPMIRPQVRIATRNCGLIDPENIDHYLARRGYRGLDNALKMTPEDVIEQIRISGLRGRGGAGFPTAAKWKFARNAPGRAKYFVCNADEGDPGAFMDRSLLEGDPHAVLEGLAIGAWAIGAEQGYIYVRAEYPLAIRRLRKAIDQMSQYGLLGPDILGSGFSLSIKIKEGAGAFVCGEETALMASIMGSRGTPRPRPPFPAQAGIDGHPTNINNVETLSNVSAILERGAEWHAGFGTEKSRGTKTFSLAGNIRRTGLIEVPMGIELGEIIYDIGGGIPGDKKLKAVQTGGPSGGCIPARLLNLPVDYESLAEAGSIMGSGGMVVMDEDTCMVEMARYFLSFTHEESCGKCTPCRIGTGSMLEVLEDITAGRGIPNDLELLADLSEAIQKGSLCGLGQTAPNPVLTTLRYFRSEYDAHIDRRRCPAVVCASLFTAPCRHACPLGTDIPSVMALVRENRLKDAHRILLRTNPFPSICGRVCNHRCQLKCRRGALDETVGIRNIERYVTDYSIATGPYSPDPVRREQIAVVGSGPAGLTAARELRLRGYPVTVFESLPEPGGMLRYAIPEYRLPKKILNREIDAVLRLGINLKLSTSVGRDIPWMQLVDEYDMVFLAVGAQKSAPMSIPGEDLRRVQGAVEFLRAVQTGRDSCSGEKVVVIGGGDSAIDAARTAQRQGAAGVHILYRRQQEDMPAQKDEIEAALEEGIEIKFLVTPTEFSGSNGSVERIICRRLELGPFDRSGRRKPLPAGDGSFEMEADRVLVAVGQSAELPFRGRNHGIRVSPGGWVPVAEGTLSMTTNPKVFTGGDVTIGPATVTEAIAAGFRAAEEIDRTLRIRNGETAYTAPDADVIDIPMAAPEETEEAPGETMRRLSVRSRCRSFAEVERGYTIRQAVHEAARCLRCDIQIETETEAVSAARRAAGT